MIRKQVAHKVMVCIVRQCLRCKGTGRKQDDEDTSPVACPVCSGTGGGNEEIPLDDLVSLVVSRIRLDARLVQKVEADCE